MDEKFNCFLDLDETLISAKTPKEELKLKLREQYIVHNMDNEYSIYERPNLQYFLDFLFDNFNVSIWTAASKSYALFIIENIILKNKNRKLDLILYSDHCDIAYKKKKGPKNLSMLWKEFELDNFNNDNTFIIDDLDKVYSAQPNNCIHIKPFSVENRDEELVKVKQLLESILVKKSLNVLKIQ